MAAVGIRVTLCLCFKTSPSAKPVVRNEFDLRENKPVGVTHFHMNGFARRLDLTQANQFGNGLSASLRSAERVP